MQSESAILGIVSRQFKPREESGMMNHLRECTDCLRRAYGVAIKKDVYNQFQELLEKYNIKISQR